ncbi:hypothetical protein [Pedobacter gandavensis]|uniref:Uncharacterized protein n=1 Tax=Pedobacter gandavensis TaxID=2679963 RepID=A0ABR6ETN6_9SPHI|nr:hypothetical protein [Pedobacter gandavensis]MBB2148637.1 hypothetical protein [Pedobacter gandavensis]
METLKVIVALVMMIGFFLLISYFTKNEAKLVLFLKARILLGCTASGFFIPQAINSSAPKQIILFALLASVILFGVVSMQNKYFTLKK